MLKFTITFFIFFSLLFLRYETVSAQVRPLSASALPDAFSNKVILSHYDSTELNQLLNTDTLKFNSIAYYYTQSFVIETFDCSDCLPFDAASFDISHYEFLRKKEESFSRLYEKQGFRLTLTATENLLYKLPIHQR